MYYYFSNVCLSKCKFSLKKNANSHIIDIEFMAILVLNHLYNRLILTVYFLLHRKL